MPKTDFQHEIAINNSSNVEVGLTLVKKNGIPQYFETVDPALGDQFFSGESDYGRLPPEKQLAITHESYIGGFGQEFEEDNLRYHYGINIDGRFKDEVRLGPLSTSQGQCPLPVSTTAAAWTNKANAYDDSTLTAATLSFAQGWSGYVEYTYTEQSTTAVRFMVTRDGPQITVCEVDVWYGAAWHNVYDDTPAYTASTWVTATFSVQDITKVRIRFFHTDSAADIISLWEMGAAGTYTRAMGAVTDMTDFGGNMYLAGGANLFEMSTTYDGFDLLYTLPATITSLLASAVAGTDYMFICLGFATDYYYMSAATPPVFTQTGLLDAEMKYMMEAEGVFYGAITSYQMRTTVNPLAGGTNWANLQSVGSSYYDIVDIKHFAGDIYFKKGDCHVYYYDVSADTVVELLHGDVAEGTSTSRMYVHRGGALLIPWGAQDLVYYDGSSLEWISPALFTGHTVHFGGSISGVTGDGFYIYLVLDDGADIQVVAGREEVVRGVNDWRWHPLATLTITNSSIAHISGVGEKRLHVASNTAAEQLTGFPVTTRYGDIDDDTDYDYQTGGYIITPYQHFNLKGDTKAYTKISVTMADTTSAIYWRAYYWKLGDSSWTEINSTDKFKTSPVTSAYIPATTTTAVTSTMIRLKFEGVTNDTTKSPKLLGYKLEGIWYPVERKLISCQVRVSDNLINAGEQTDDMLGTTIRTTLDTINSLNFPRAFYPPYWATSADTVYVKKLPLPYGAQQLEPVRFDKDSPATWVYNLLLEIVQLS